ncbi:MAG: hypothetical protein LAO24_12955 [Acidobacteriia bacterium]|nr:hypothetical protein [Terriglobia bacterium]
MRFSDLRLTKFGIVLLADAALLLVVWLILLVSWGGGASWLVHLLLVTAVVFVAIAFWGRRPKSRIKFLPPNKTVFVAEAEVRYCYACRQELKPGQEKARCSVTSSHEVHLVCSERLVRGKCPQCGNALLPERLQDAG